MNGPAVSARDVSKSYAARRGRVAAVEGFSLDVADGEAVCLAGPSGAGKTVLVNLLAGWEQPDQGTVMWAGRRDRPPWSDTTVVPQMVALIEELTVFENVTLSLRLLGSDLGRASAVMERLGIGHLADRIPSEVSVGERQRTMVARALAGMPRLVLADEPTAHQDAANARRVHEALGSHVADGGACVIATRKPLELGLATRVIDLSDLPSETGKIGGGTRTRREAE